MKVTEREIWSDDKSCLACICQTGKLHTTAWILETNEWPAYQECINNWLDHGTFTEKPIEWVEAVPGVVWVATGTLWWVQVAENNYCVFNGRAYVHRSGCLGDAKSYAEQRIREEVKRA